jgi:hypothetical protein
MSSNTGLFLTNKNGQQTYSQINQAKQVPIKATTT